MRYEGFEEIVKLAQNKQRVNGEIILETEEIVKRFDELGHTSGVAAGTIRRACDRKLLERISRGIFRYNENYNDYTDCRSVDTAKQTTETVPKQPTTERDATSMTTAEIVSTSIEECISSLERNIKISTLSQEEMMKFFDIIQQLKKISW